MAKPVVPMASSSPTSPESPPFKSFSWPFCDPIDTRAFLSWSAVAASWLFIVCPAQAKAQRFTSLSQGMTTQRSGTSRCD